jgi:hypothetical protein
MVRCLEGILVVDVGSSVCWSRVANVYWVLLFGVAAVRRCESGLFSTANT